MLPECPQQLYTCVEEAKRLQAEADEAKRIADEAEAKRAADEAEAQKLAKEAADKKLAIEAEQKQHGEHLAEQRRLAEEAAKKTLADADEERRLVHEAIIAKQKEEEAARRREQEANPKYIEADRLTEVLSKLKAQLDEANAAEPVDEEQVKKLTYDYNEQKLTTDQANSVKA